jgi:gluconolactonase
MKRLLPDHGTSCRLALALALPLATLGGCARQTGTARADPPPARTPTAAAAPNPELRVGPTVLTPAHDPPLGHVGAIVDLTTQAGLATVRGEWRYSDVRIVEVPARGPGADLKPSGAAVKTYDYAPKAGVTDFDDSKWPVIAPSSLEARRGNGKLSFAWYRLRVTLPERVGNLDLAGATVGFEVVIDDYAEVWVDGKLARELGQAGGSVVSGFNAPNRVVLTRDARPGQHFEIAVFGMNGPISAAPDNFIWVKSATLDLIAKKSAPVEAAPLARLERLDPALDAILGPDVRVERLAGGFGFIEGPVWSAATRSLLFSDPNENTIYRYDQDGALSIFRPKSGYRGSDVSAYHQPGSNGLALDREGRVTINEHGNRRVTRLERNGVLTVLADRFEGKRLNSPNDLVYKSDGSLYFTDPPFGLPRTFEDPQKELPYSGVFRWSEGKLALLTTELAGPNGLAFSPDEKYLYVDNWDTGRKVVMRYPVSADGGLGAGSVFFDMTGAPGEEALDGLKVDSRGNVFVSGPGGVWILSAEGKHLGTLRVAELPANFAWGDADRRSLYLTARTGLYRVRLNVAGAGAYFE